MAAILSALGQPLTHFDQNRKRMFPPGRKKGMLETYDHSIMCLA